MNDINYAPVKIKGRSKLLNLIDGWGYGIRVSCQENHE